MRFYEFKNVQLKEGGASQGTQFNSEVGLLAAMCGVDPATFDPKNPEPSFANSPYTVGQETFNNIKAQAEFYKADKFNKWVKVVGPKVTNLVMKELAKLNIPPPTELGWVASQNQSSVADVKFINHPVDGISVKEQGAPTLANLTAKTLGLDTGPDGDSDVFRHFAKDEWDAVKEYVFRTVLNIAKGQPGKPFAPGKDKYSITYMTGEIPQDAGRLRPPKVQQPVQQTPNAPTPAHAPQQQQQAQPAVAPPNTELSENASSTGYFVIKFGEKKVSEPEDRIMIDLPKNAEWQRVFGDYFQAYWGKDQTLSQLGAKLFTKIGVDFVSKIKTALAVQNNLHSAVKMGDVTYFYATPSHVFYVPAVNNKRNLQLQDLRYTSPKGTNQNFEATIGFADEEPASVLIYIRYANGIFQTSPTVRVQRLKNPQGLGWIKL